MKTTGPAGILIALVIGCAETSIAPPPAALQPYTDSARFVEETDSAPEGAPDEYQFPTMIHAVEADAGYVDSYAYAQTIVRYTATNALARATVKTDVGSNSKEEETSQILPVRTDFGTEVNLKMGTCVGSIRGEAFGKVWNELLVFGSFRTWGTKSRAASTDRGCPEPTTNTPSTGGDGGEGDGGTSCQIIVIDWYWYYPDTGDLEYRYTERYSSCESTDTHGM